MRARRDDYEIKPTPSSPCRKQDNRGNLYEEAGLLDCGWARLPPGEGQYVGIRREVRQVGRAEVWKQRTVVKGEQEV